MPIAEGKWLILDVQDVQVTLQALGFTGLSNLADRDQFKQHWLSAAATTPQQVIPPDTNLIALHGEALGYWTVERLAARPPLIY